MRVHGPIAIAAALTALGPGALHASVGIDPPTPAPPKFYAYCVETGVPGVKPRPVADQARLLKGIGFDGIGLPLRCGAALDADLAALDAASCPPFLLWTTIKLAPDGTASHDPGLPEAIGKLRGRPATLSLLLTGLNPGDPAGIPVAVRVLDRLGALADAAGIRLSIYNHVNNWTERIAFAVEVVRAVDHPSVGFNFNLCHWLKIHGKADPLPLLRAHVDRLFCVTINGAQIGADTWTHGLIQPLDRGDFDNRALLAALARIGYRGPVGLMCYGVPDDPRDHLTRSFRTWQTWHAH